MRLAGLLLAAGAGRRMGRPKALLRDAHGVWFLDRAVAVLREGGCDRVTVVLGASADDARPLLEAAGRAVDVVDAVVAEDWDEGMGASLRAGLEALAAGDAEAALVTLVDLPDVDGRVLRRVVEAGLSAGPRALVRTTYDGRPGHPVLLGREHWAGVAASATGDEGARRYLAAHEVTEVDCTGLADPTDLDVPPGGVPSAP